MTADELWQKFIQENKIENCDYEAWSFGADPDLLARLVITGQKTGTSSAYALYEFGHEALPKVDDYSVILDSKGNAVCIIKNIKVEVLAFHEITSEHAYHEGEGDRSLDYWKSVHEDFFKSCLSEAGIEFSYDIKVVYEEFAVVYR